MRFNPNAPLDGSQVRLAPGVTPNTLHGLAGPKPFRAGLPMPNRPAGGYLPKPPEAGSSQGFKYVPKPQKAVGASSLNDLAAEVASKRLGRNVNEDENLILDPMVTLQRRQFGSGGRQRADRADFSMERLIAARRRLPNARTNNV